MGSTHAGECASNRTWFLVARFISCAYLHIVVGLLCSPVAPQVMKQVVSSVVA